MIEFEVVASDGLWTIGYTMDGVAGFIEGNMKDSFEKASDFQSAHEGFEFYAGNFFYRAELKCDRFGDKIMFWNKIKKHKNWRGCNFNDFVRAGDEIDSEIYHYFMEVVPPIYFHHGFLCGEPSTHRGGEAAHRAFTYFDGKYRYIGEFTEEEAKIIGRFLHNVF